ncbi:MAG: hypothetical protein J7521_11175 [Caulobacter sp.]|nr:hypothetical protein [Caulobacter sp.]
MRTYDVLAEDSDQIEFGGVRVRRNSLAAFLANAAFLGRPGLPADVQDIVLREIFEALPALRAIGLFDVFEIRDPRLRAFVAASL